jgi:hypothetical protein
MGHFANAGMGCMGLLPLPARASMAPHATYVYDTHTPSLPFYPGLSGLKVVDVESNRTLQAIDMGHVTRWKTERNVSLTLYTKGPRDAREQTLVFEVRHAASPPPPLPSASGPAEPLYCRRVKRLSSEMCWTHWQQPVYSESGCFPLLHFPLPLPPSSHVPHPRPSSSGCRSSSTVPPPSKPRSPQRL